MFDSRSDDKINILPVGVKRTCPPIFVVEIYPPLEDPDLSGPCCALWKK